MEKRKPLFRRDMIVAIEMSQFEKHSLKLADCADADAKKKVDSLFSEIFQKSWNFSIGVLMEETEHFVMQT